MIKLTTAYVAIWPEFVYLKDRPSTCEVDPLQRRMGENIEYLGLFINYVNWMGVSQKLTQNDSLVNILLIDLCI